MRAEPHWVPGLLAETRTGTADVTCVLCPFRCVLAPGEVGRCNVRRGAADGIETATFAVGPAHTDPVERKPLYHYRPGSHLLTLAAPGCTFRCNYCVNHRVSQYGRSAGSIWDAERADVRALIAMADADRAGIALSYTEPALAIELSLALAAIRGEKIVWKTNGFLTPEALALASPVLAAVNVDLKAAEEQAHRRLTGAPLAPVIDTIAELHRRGVWVEVSTPLIPTISATPEALTEIARTIAAISPAIPWHLGRFTPAYRMRHHDPTPPAALRDGVAAGRAAGLRYVYVERALGDEGRTTRCPGCDTAVIGRDVWKLRDNRLRKGGACPRCDRPMEGVW